MAEAGKQIWRTDGGRRMFKFFLSSVFYFQSPPSAFCLLSSLFQCSLTEALQSAIFKSIRITKISWLSKSRKDQENWLSTFKNPPKVHCVYI